MKLQHTALIATLLAYGCQGTPDENDQTAGRGQDVAMVAGPRPAPTPGKTTSRIEGDVETVKQDMYCYNYDSNPPFLCQVWAPTPPPGFFDCAGNANVYDGELVLFTGTSYGGFCMYAHPNPTLSDSPLGDMDTSTWHIRSYKSRLHNGGTLFDQTGYLPQSQPGYWPIFAGSDSWSNFTSFQPSSLKGFN